MSTELFDPQRFGFKRSRRTIFSDCYALGTVIYELLSGRAPFSELRKLRLTNAVIGMRTLQGDRPRRPQGVEGICFADHVWEIAEHCWKPKPRSRPSADQVLQFLEEASGTWTPPLMLEGPQTTAPSTLTSSSSFM
ncbi:hypothetical protein BDM02DRAFT_3120655 [Thelephora ganbajun]|uniref:Uncharacterized protein n=1 Tax=Thelephora ganbajun TaxID=370292 RepID=A0ACB6Z656_THEGA|nr:hypothetical protein BDM02DRAFT_3120655 [Thelephora ganbajun]